MDLDLTESLENYFLTEKEGMSAGVIIKNLELTNIMKLRKFGASMIVKAQDQAEELARQGNITKRMQVELQLFKISDNLRKIEIAYRIIMN